MRERLRRAWRIPAVAVVGAFAVASCAQPSAAPVVEHVHNIAIDGEDLYLGTHAGLFRQAPGKPLTQVSADSFDVMGLARDGDRWLASGHPGEGMEGPADLGLLASTDGVTWEPRALYGEVDFHRLTASGGTVVGVSAHEGALMRSSDSGETWETVNAEAPFDVALDPRDPSVVVGTTADGPVLSSDGGRTFAPLPDAPLIALVAWTGRALYGVDPEGRVHVSVDGARTWTSAGSVDGEPVAIAANDDAVAVLADGTVHYSTDGGRTFEARLTGLGDH